MDSKSFDVRWLDNPFLPISKSVEATTVYQNYLQTGENFQKQYLKTSELLPFELKDVSSEFGNCEAKRVKSELEGEM